MPATLRQKIQTSISTRLSAIVVSAVVSAVVFGALASAWREADRRFQSVRSELEGISAAIAVIVAEPLEAGSRTDVTQALVAISRIPNIRFVQVQDARGLAIAQLGDSVVLEAHDRALEPNRKLDVFSTLNLRNYIIEAPIVSGGRPVGRLLLIADVTRLRGALVESVLGALLAGLVAAVLAIVIVRPLQQSVTRPVAALTAAMQEVRSGKDYSRTVERTSDDETGLMVDAFNAMLSEINERDARLAGHNERLEGEVQQRTVELEAAKIAAEQASAAKSDFLATMSHEIRTPLNGMLVMAELLASGDLPPRMQRHADVIVGSGQSLVAIINDILDLSKIEAGRLDLEEVPVSPRALMEQIVNLFAVRASSKSLDLVCSAGTEVPLLIAADPVRINQVLANLVNNALKFTESGHVAVRIDCLSAGRPGAGRCRLRFSVEDTGIGIPKDKIDSVFEAFTQAEQSTARRFGGTGIGLTISRRLVGAMGGQLKAESVLGRGSEFYFEAEFAVLEAARSPVQKVGSCVAVALDLTASRAAAADTIRSLGFEVRFIGSKDALPSHDEALAIITTPERIEAMGARRGQRTFSIAAVPVGDVRVGALLDSGAVDMTIMRPLLPSEIEAALDAAREGTRQAGSRVEPATELRAPPVRFDGVSILAADDNAVNREVLSEALARLGARVTLAEDGRVAVEMLRDRAFDLVFMDCSMPVMDGFEATRAIRAREAECGLARTPIVALTAHVAGTAVDAWRDAGMDDYLTKPFTLTSLTGCLQRLLSQRAPDSAAGTMAADDTSGGSQERAAPVLDLQVIEDIRAMQSPGDDLVVRIMGLFRQHAPVAFERLAADAAIGGAADIASSAHALKSMCRNIGAVRLGAKLDEIEDGARSRGLGCSPEMVAELRDEFDSVLDGLEAAVRLKGSAASEKVLRKAS